MRLLSWHDFDRAVATIAERLHGRSFSGVHGLPRGGLVLAVSLSHRLELPLLPAPQPGCLVVDDVYETGRTLAPFRQLEAVEVWPDPEWIVFPWEDSARAAEEERSYRQSRR